MKQSLQLRLGQQLTMTPQLQQAIRLLQLSTIELQSEIQEAIDSNMMLEAVEEQGAAPAESGQREEDTVEPSDIPGELAIDTNWDDIYDLPATATSTEEGTTFDSYTSQRETLRASLLWQLTLASMSDTERLIATAIVDAIDDDGYLRQSETEICEVLARHDLPVDAGQVEAALRRVQEFDPPGVGARDLRECLLLQLRSRPADTPGLADAERLVADHLERLAAHDYTQLMRAMDLEAGALQRAIDLVRSLSPRPGSDGFGEEARYIVPDVLVRRAGERWIVELNPDLAPRLRINPYYASLVRRADNSADNTTMRNQLQEARWFIKSLRSRGQTLLKVSRCIVERQRDFLEHGPIAMRPMVLHDIASAVEMHESTISRVTTNKYMHTPHGIVELKYFFSSHVATTTGGEASSTAIRELLKRLIESEDARRPLSDSKLARILADQGIDIARRTVAKYRESLAIPSSQDRRRLA